MSQDGPQAEPSAPRPGSRSPFTALIFFGHRRQNQRQIPAVVTSLLARLSQFCLRRSRAPPLSSSRLRATTIFLPNFPAELTEGCEGQGACPGSPSETAKPLASGQGCGTLVPAPSRVPKGPFINNRNNRISFLFGGRTPQTATGVVVGVHCQALAGWKAHEPKADGPGHAGSCEGSNLYQTSHGLERAGGRYG